MELKSAPFKLGAFCCISLLLSSCSSFSYMQTSDDHLAYPTVPQTHNNQSDGKKVTGKSTATPPKNYAARLPAQLHTGEKTILVDPSTHAWGAYNAQGELIRAGLATAGANWCPDIKRACRTKAGSFRIQSLGSAACKSTRYPVPRGGAPMPYCMFFNGHQGLHGSPQGAVVEGNISHGCVRMHVSDAEWIRFNFANIGTKVIVKPY